MIRIPFLKHETCANKGQTDGDDSHSRSDSESATLGRSSRRAAAAAGSSPGSRTRGLGSNGSRGDSGGLRSVGTSNRLDLEGLAASNDLGLIKDIAKVENVAGAGVQRGDGREQDGAVVIPLDGNQVIRSSDAWPGDPDREVGISFIVLSTASPAVEVLGVGNPPVAGAGCDNGDFCRSKKGSQS